MFHWFDVIQNNRGDALPSWQAGLVNVDTQDVVPIFADENGTPIATVSGVANRAVADENGNYDFFVPSGTYTIQFFNSAGVFQRAQRFVAMFGEDYATESIQSAADSAAAAAASAAAAAAFSGPIYVSTALGLAGTVDGQEFVVRPNVTDLTADIYLNSAGTAIYSRTIIISPEFLGLVLDTDRTGATDATAIVQAALNEMEARGGGRVTVFGVLKIDSNLTIPSGVILDGGIRNPDPGRAGLAPVLNRAPRIALASTATITLRNSSGIQGLYIQRQGLTTGEDPATWAGTAITVKGAGTFQGDLFVAGFNRWCDATSAANDERCARLRAERVLFDCRNGIVIEQCFDIPYLFECHGNDLTAATTTLRDGVGFQFSNSVDWGRATNCFTYGYAVGFRVDDADDCIFTNCGADYLPTGTSTAIGFDISGTARTTKLIGCQSAATGTAVRVDVGTSLFPHVLVEGCSFWDIDTAGVSLLSGNVTVTGSYFNGGNQTAILTANTADATSVVCVGNTFNDPTTVYNIQNAATLNRSTFWGNRLIDCADSTVGEVLTFDEGKRDLITLRSANSTNVGARFTFDKARGTSASPSLPNASDATINLIGRGWTGSAWGNSAQIRAQFEGAPSGTSTAGRIIFSTTPSGSTSSTDRVIITASGGVVMNALPTYADNAAAVAGGLAVNSLYKTAAGELRIVV